MNRNSVQPSDICFINCFPVSKPDFIQLSSKSHFIASQVAKSALAIEDQWKNYNDRLLVFYEKLRDRFSLYGVEFIDKGSLPAVADAIGSGKKIVVIFVHNTDPANKGDYEVLDFYGERVSTSEIEKLIPLAFDGILDLSTCHVAYFPSRLKTSRPKMVCKSHRDDTVELAQWLFIYGHIFEFVCTGNVTYIEAYRLTFRRLNPTFYDILRDYFSISRWKRIIQNI